MLFLTLPAPLPTCLTTTFQESFLFSLWLLLSTEGLSAEQMHKGGWPNWMVGKAAVLAISYVNTFQATSMTKNNLLYSIFRF